MIDGGFVDPTVQRSPPTYSNRQVGIITAAWWPGSKVNERKFRFFFFLSDLFDFNIFIFSYFHILLLLMLMLTWPLVSGWPLGWLPAFVLIWWRGSSFYYFSFFCVCWLFPPSAAAPILLYGNVALSYQTMFQELITVYNEVIGLVGYSFVYCRLFTSNSRGFTLIHEDSRWPNGRCWLAVMSERTDDGINSLRSIDLMSLTLIGHFDFKCAV